MRIPVLLLLAAVSLFAQAGGTVLARGPKVGSIEVFGHHKVPQDKILKALGVVEGGPLPASKVDSEERVESIDGVLKANLEAVCCENGKAILYLGVEERGAPHLDYYPAPTVEITLPEEVYAEWREFITAIDQAARRGSTDEDLTQGHSLMADPDVRASQLKFVGFAEQHYDLLREVLKKAISEEQRGIAAYVLGYSTKKQEVAGDLQFALRDPDSTVRNNAMRGLMALAVYGRLHPESQVKVAPTWFVETLHSMYFTDRVKAATALYTFSETRDPGLLSHLRERAVGPLTEMARWRNLSHALPAFYVLGRTAGLPEEEIQTLWKDGKRDLFFRQVNAALQSKK